MNRCRNGVNERTSTLRGDTTMSLRKPIHQVLTIPDFVKHWDKKIDKIIASYGLQDMAEDIKQDIYLDVATPDKNPDSPTFGQNGLERYDPLRGAFSTYVYGLVLVRVRNARSRRVRELGLMPFSHDGTSYDQGDDGRASRIKDRNEANAQDISGKTSEIERAEFLMQIEHAKDALKNYPVRSYFFRDGDCITRDLATLLDLVLQGKSRDEIVSYFEYSTGSVGVMFDQLRQVPELQELKDMIPGLAI